MFTLSIFMYYIFFFQAEDGIRDLVRSRGLGDVYKRQDQVPATVRVDIRQDERRGALTRRIDAGSREPALALSLIHI